MSTGYQIIDQKTPYFLTFQVVDWIDIFTRKYYKDIIIDCFRFMIDNKDFQLYAYVIMSNHIHLIAQSGGRLSENVRDIKKFTSIKIIQAIKEQPESRKDWILKIFKANGSLHKSNREYQVWTHENHAILLSTNEFIRSKVDYIHDNPVRTGIVEKPEDYLYSSARNYATLDAPIDIQTLFLPWKTYS